MRPHPTLAAARPGGSVVGLAAVLIAGALAFAALGLVRPADAQAAGTATRIPLVPQAAQTTPKISLPNPFSYLFGNWIEGVFKAKGQATLKQIIGASEASLLTPPVQDNARVVQIWQLLVEIGDSILLLLIIVGAVMVIAGDWTYLEAKALAPRIIISGVALNLSLVVAGQAINLSNAAVQGFLSVGNLSTNGHGLDAFQKVSAPVLLALLLLAGLALLLTNLIRLVIVLVITVGGPLCNVFGVLPATDGIATGWWRALAACLIAPAVQALLLVIGVWIALAPASPFQAAFGGQAWSGLVDAVMVVAIVVLMAISPLWMLKKALGGGYHHLAAAARWGRRAVMA